MEAISFFWGGVPVWGILNVWMVLLGNFIPFASSRLTSGGGAGALSK